MDKLSHFGLTLIYYERIDISMRNKIILTLSTLAFIAGGVYALPNHSNNSTYTSPDPTSPTSLDQPTNTSIDPLSPTQSSTDTSTTPTTDPSSPTSTSSPTPQSPTTTTTDPAITTDPTPSAPVVVSGVSSIDEELRSTCVLTYSDGTTSSYEWRKVIVNKTSTGEIRNELLVAICNDSLIGQPKS